MGDRGTILIALLALAVGVQIGAWIMRRGAEQVSSQAVDALASVHRALVPGGVAWGVVEILGHRRLVGRLSTAYVLNEPFLKVETFKMDGGFEEELYPERSVFSLRFMKEESARREAVPVWANDGACGAFVESKILAGVCGRCGQPKEADEKEARAHKERAFRDKIRQSLATIAGQYARDLVVQWDDAAGQVVRVVSWKSEAALTVEQWERATLEGLPMGPVECAVRTDLILDTPEDLPF